MLGIRMRFTDASHTSGMRFRRLENTSLERIEAMALNAKSDLATGLRLCISLGGTARSADLRKWAHAELTGYGPDDDLPEYRKFAAPLVIDAVVHGGRITGQMVTATMLPEGMSEIIDEPVPMKMPLTDIPGLVANATDGSIFLGMPGGHLLVPLMNSHLQGRAVIDRVYWKVSAAQVAGITEVVRTKLVSLVAEIRSALPVGVDQPSEAVADAATQVVVYGKGARVNIQNVSTSAVGGDVVVNQAGRASTAGEPESTTRKITYWVFGIATLVGTVIAILALK